MTDNDFEIVAEITEVEVIAIGPAIRELANLRKLFGKARWRKLKGIATIQFRSGAIYVAELHWYEAHGIGKRKMKPKRLIRKLK